LVLLRQPFDVFARRKAYFEAVLIFQRLIKYRFQKR